jgi:Lrp/AsnC family transcriptional regulator for asnA, asnC and gidA
MKELEKRLLRELLKDSKQSDREIAKKLGVSQATITRNRNNLVKDGVIKEFTIMPDLVKLGYEIMAISCVKKKAIMTEASKKAIEWMEKYPNIIFVAEAEGMGKNGVMISLHKNYTEYSSFVGENMRYWGNDLEAQDTILIGLKGLIVKPLSLSYLAKQVEKSED